MPRIFQIQIRTAGQNDSEQPLTQRKKIDLYNVRRQRRKTIVLSCGQQPTVSQELQKSLRYKETSECKYATLKIRFWLIHTHLCERSEIRSKIPNRESSVFAKALWSTYKPPYKFAGQQTSKDIWWLYYWNLLQSLKCLLFIVFFPF